MILCCMQCDTLTGVTVGTNTTLSAAPQCTAEKDSELRTRQMKCQNYEKVDDASCGENIFRVQWIYEANLDFSQMCTFAGGLAGA